MAVRIQNKRDTAANWTSNNTVLLAGEIGYESDTGKFKIGDGTTAWSSLGYFRFIDQEVSTTSSPSFTNLTLPNTTFANQNGFIYKVSNRFVHNFNYGNNGAVTTVGENCFIGELAGNLTMGSTATGSYEASYNVGIGYQTLLGNTTGYYNTGVGRRCLQANTTGYSNNAMGASALTGNTTGYYNNAMGAAALQSNTTGRYNNAIGAGSLLSNTTGEYNNGCGAYALRSNTTGSSNNAIGANALYSNKRGFSNNAIGSGTMYSNTTGYYNNAVGIDSLQSNTTGYLNHGGGAYSLKSNTTGYYNCGVGPYVLVSLKPTSKAITAFADYSGTVAGTVLATSAGHGLTGTSTKQISGTVNYDGSKSITVVDDNTFYFTATWVSTETGWWGVLSEGRYNTAVGANAGRSLTTGSSNIFLGYAAGYYQTTADNLFIVDWTQRGSAASEAANAILYGVTAAVAANQTLRINADLTVNANLTFNTRGLLFQESAGSVDFCNNLYNDGSWKYKTSDYGILFQTGAGGDFSVFTAPSGTAGNAASLTQRLYLTNAGALTVGGAIRSNSGFNMNGTAGAGGSFTTVDGKTVTVSGGIITSIV